jgi:indolepyruvate ferredoxin oxidoreductase
MSVDPRFLAEQGAHVFTGNELLVKGALETEGGVHLLTGYPGSPVAGFFDCLESIAPLLDEHGMVAKMANNEALSVAMVNGAQMAGCRAITAFKSVGLHVASDALALGVLAGTRETSGGLIICGDDPWSDSTQVPADSRYLAEHVRMPMIEPCCPQEVKDWVDAAFKIGHAGRIFIGYSMLVATADGGGTVECRPNHYPTVNEKQKRTLSYVEDIEPELDNSVLLPPRTWQREMTLESRHEAVKAEARKLGVNRILYRPHKGERVPLGFIAAGMGYAYLAHALAEMGLAGRLPILKLGMTYPVDDKLVREFAQHCEQIVVVEERRAFVERQVLEILNPLRQSGELQTQVYGKEFPKPHKGFPSTRGLNPSLVIEHLVPLIRQHATLPVELTNGHLTDELNRIKATEKFEIDLADRTPTFCPGCPHRDSSSVLLELRNDMLDPHYMLEHHKRKPVDLVTHGDTGCYTMLMFEPNKPLMHNYSGMGLGGATGSGVDPFIDNKQMVFMGDGTFFHSGQVAISHSIKSNQDITYVILDNKTTAMTGHQTHAGIEHDLMGRPNFAQDIERIVAAMIPKEMAKGVRVVRTDPEDRDRYRKLLEQTILADGVKVIIADKECGITYNRRVKSDERKTIADEGFLPKKTFMNVASEVCEFCLECTNQTGCPGLKIEDTDYGPKIQTDLSTCVNDGACQRIHACPSFEEVTILRKQAPRKVDEIIDLSNIPDPPRPIHADQDIWRAYLAGVGGMGIGLCTSILVQAGHEMGYHVQFLDKKGLAIRNGGVSSQIVYTRQHARGSRPSLDGTGQNGSFTTPQAPYGKVDLLLGVDLLEAVRALDPNQPRRAASPERTTAIVNTCKTPTILSLMGRDDFDVASLETTLRKYTRGEGYFGFNVGDLCERVLDNKLYANIMMLGIAFQRGLLPMTPEALEKAIRIIVRRDTERNLRAFNIGRKIVVRPDLFVVEPTHQVESARKALRRKTNALRNWYGRGRRADTIVRQFHVLMKQTWRAAGKANLDDALLRDVVIRGYDCAIWGGIDYAKRYCHRLVDVFAKDSAAFDYRITRSVVHNLAKVMLIKDEVYVSAMLTSQEKYKRDKRRYKVNDAAGDRIIYKHYNRPEFDILGYRVRFEMKTRDWQLRIMSRMRFLRKLMPKWHIREKSFRDWYESLVDQLDFTSPRDYQRWLEILSVPDDVTGYREVRYPKMAAAQTHAEKLLAMDPESFEPTKPAKPNTGSGKRVQLTVLSGAGTT